MVSFTPKQVSAIYFESKKLFLISIISGLIIGSCSNSQHPDTPTYSLNETVELDELCQLTMEERVISAVLRENYIKRPNDTVFNKKGGIVHIQKYQKPELSLFNRTIKDSLDTSYLRSLGMDEISRDLVEDYQKKNDTISIVRKIYVPGAEIRIVDSETIDSKTIFGETLIHFSSPGFNSNKTRAIIFFTMYCGPLSFSCEYYILELDDNIWIVKDRILTILS